MKLYRAVALCAVAAAREKHVSLKVKTYLSVELPAVITETLAVAYCINCCYAEATGEASSVALKVY